MNRSQTSLIIRNATFSHGSVELEDLTELNANAMRRQSIGVRMSVHAYACGIVVAFPIHVRCTHVMKLDFIFAAERQWAHQSGQLEQQ